MINSSGFGVKVILIATGTFPVGFVITQFADNADSIAVENVDIADGTVGMNGDFIRWQAGKPILIDINVIPGGTDDRNLQILAEANRATLGKVPINDVITLTKVLPDGTGLMAVKGVLVNAPIGTSIEGSGRLKTKTYKFKFENAFGI
jgi:hypothetical protein